MASKQSLTLAFLRWGLFMTHYMHLNALLKAKQNEKAY